MTFSHVRGALLGLMILSAPGLAQSDDSAFTPEQREELEGLFRQWLLDNPEVIPEAIQILQQRDRDQQLSKARTFIEENRDLIMEDPYAPTLGDADAPVTVVEFYDYQCSFCRQAYPAMRKLIDQEEKVRFVFKQLPILDRPDDEEQISRIAAGLALAAKKQGNDKFLKFHDTVMRSEGQLTEERLFQMAENAGLNRRQLALDAKADWLTDYLNGNLALARALNVRGTPAYVINTQVVYGALGYEAIKTAIERARDEAVEEGR